MSQLTTLFETNLKALETLPVQKIAVAVSGGADSLCLACLAQEWANARGISLTALTVNHGLRENAAQEAKSVSKQMRALGIQHRILNWTGEKPTTRIEEKAREARYALLCDFCRQKKIPVLLLAHHRGDNIETFFLRLAKASGLTGLAGMHPFKKREDILLVRPLLDVSKEQIIQFLTRRQIHWIEDPMNQNPLFERVYWRKQWPTLEKMGLNPDYLQRTLARLRRADRALQQMSMSAFQHLVHVDNRGFAQIPLPAFDQLPDEIQIRLLLRLIPLIGDSGKPVSLEKLESILQTKPARATLGMCYVIRHKQGLFIAKEATRMPKPLALKKGIWTTWDRFIVRSSVPARIEHRTKREAKCPFPWLVQQSFPIIRDKKGLEIYPHLDYKEKPSHINIIIQFLPLTKG